MYCYFYLIFFIALLSYRPTGCPMDLLFIIFHVDNFGTRVERWKSCNNVFLEINFYYRLLSVNYRRENRLRCISFRTAHSFDLLKQRGGKNFRHFVVHRIRIKLLLRVNINIIFKYRYVATKDLSNNRLHFFIRAGLIVNNKKE